MEKKRLLSMETGFWISLGLSLILFVLDACGKKDSEENKDKDPGEQTSYGGQDIDSVVRLNQLTIDELASADLSTAELQELMEEYVAGDTKEGYEKAAEIRDLINSKIHSE